jgi:hypothetical protein
VTDCAVCRWAEMTRAQRLRSRLRRLVLPPSVAEVRAHQAHAFAGVFRAFAGWLRGRRTTNTGSGTRGLGTPWNWSGCSVTWGGRPFLVRPAADPTRTG